MLSIFSRFKILFRSFLVLLLLTINTIAVNADVIPTQIKQQLLQGRFEEAANSLESLVSENNSEAKYQLAILLLNGRGITQSVNRAESLLKEASKTSSDAAFLLGSIYFKGKQLSKDKDLAKYYLTLASKSGHQRAKNMLAQIEESSSKNKRIKPQTQRLFELAITSGNLSLVIKQYLKGANLNALDDQGDTPLIKAMKLGRKDVVQWLLKQQVDLTQKNRLGNTALHIAAKLGAIEYMIAMKKQLKQIDFKNTQKKTPLIIAIINKQQAMAQWLINNGANTKIKDSFGKSAFGYNQSSKLALAIPVHPADQTSQNRMISQKQMQYKIKQLKAQAANKSNLYYNWPILSIAIAQGQIDIAENLISNGHSPWQKGIDNSTPMSLILQNDHSKLFNKVLARHPIRKVTNKNLIEHLFIISIEKNKPRLIEEILSNQSQIAKMEMVEKGLEKAIKDQRVKSVKYLLSLSKGYIDNNLLTLSISETKSDISKLIVKRVKDVNQPDNEGITALILAAQKRNSKTIIHLLQNNANIGIKDKQGLTALMWATKQSCLSCVSELIKHGANPETTSNVGNNSFMLAAKKSDEILKMIISEETDLTVRNQQSLTALMLAVINDCADCVKTLITHGANPKRRNSKGQDSFDLSVNKPEILALLSNN